MKSLDIKPKIRIQNKRRAKPFQDLAPIKIDEPAFEEKPKGKKTIFGTIGLVILIGLLLLFFILPEASLKVTAQTEPITRDFEIRADKNLTEVDSATLSIPAQVIDSDEEQEKSYPSTGVKNVGRKASGFVHIYNFSKTTLTLKAATTVVYVGDQKYYFTQDITGIRPTALIGLEDQEVDETSLIAPVPIVAAEPGEKYNLAKGARLEIENQVFGKQPKSLYAKVAEDVSGGSTKELKFVTAQDIDAAYAALATELGENEKTKLGSEANIVTTVNEKSTAAQIGAEVPEFSVKVKAKITGLAFKREDAMQAITDRIKRLLPENKVLRDDSSTRLSASFLNIDYNAGYATLATHYEGEIVYKVNPTEIVDRSRGKTRDEIKEILLSRPEIADVQIKLYPAWIKKSPKFANKVDVQVVNASP